MLDDKQTANCSLRLQKRNKQTKDSRYRSIYNRKWPIVRFSNNIARDRWLREGGKLSQRHFELFYTSRVSTIKRVTFIIFTLRLMLFYVSPRMNINLAYIFTDNVMLLVSRSNVCMYVYTCSLVHVRICSKIENFGRKFLEWESNEILEPAILALLVNYFFLLLSLIVYI